jgi:hypothetical protein
MLQRRTWLPVSPGWQAPVLQAEWHCSNDSSSKHDKEQAASHSFKLGPPKLATRLLHSTLVVLLTLTYKIEIWF